MKKIINTLLLGSVILFSGCSVKDSDICEMKNSRIILNIQLKDDSEENQELLTKIRNINTSFNIPNDKTNLTNINTSYLEAKDFFDRYYELINEERENIVNTESEFKRSLKNSFKERTSTCTTKTRYIDGVTKEKETNVEYLLNLED